MATTLLYLVIAFIVLDYVLDMVLGFLNGQTWSDQLPGELRGYYDEAKYTKSRQYDKANTNFARWFSTFNLLLILGMIGVGGFAFYDEWLRDTFTTDPIYLAVLFFVGLFIATDILSTPFSIYSGLGQSLYSHARHRHYFVSRLSQIYWTPSGFGTSSIQKAAKIPHCYVRTVR